jgi:tight adherence protein C
MTIIEIGFLSLIFVSVFGIALAGFRMAGTTPIQGRIDAVGAAVNAPSSGPPPWLTRVVALAEPVAKLSLPSDESEASVIRVRFMNAGFRHPWAPVVFFAAKTFLALGLPLAVFFGLSVSS